MKSIDKKFRLTIDDSIWRIIDLSLRRVKLSTSRWGVFDRNPESSLEAILRDTILRGAAKKDKQ